MSINVNVTGNPVRIHRGKMVTANPDYAKDEFQKRRRMRMEQVRQQSKDIAETVRNRVRNEQNKHLSDMEKQGEKELKKWQTRKLLQLQKQYHECLQDIGLGHSEAIIEEESDYAMETRKESYNKAAKERGYRAAEKLHKQKDQENIDKSEGLQKKTYNQAIENARAKLVADLNKNKKNKSPFKKKKRKVYTDINISNRLSGGSDSGSDVPELFNISSSSYSSTSAKEIVKKSTRKDSSPRRISAGSDDPENRKQLTNRCGKEKPCPRRVSPLRSKMDERTKRNYYADTRISDRIKSRTILSDSCCEPHAEICDKSSPVNAHRVREAILIHSGQPGSPKGSPKQLSPPLSPKIKMGTCLEEGDVCPAKCNTSKGRSFSKSEPEEIPNKPTISLNTESSHRLKSFGQSSNNNLNKVQYYDHKHRFTNKLIPDSSSVQRIPEESIEVCPSSRSEAEFQEQMYKRDQEAQSRGQKALQKEKVRRDYKEMMQQLPNLQKQERVASIPSKKNSFHMSEDRLKQREKKKQNQMENAYEKLFPKARVITIPPKNSGKATPSNILPFQTIDVNETEPSINVGSWDIDAKPKYSASLSPNSKQTIDKTNEDKEEKERKENLQDMLRSLKFHRDKLVKELSSLPESDNRQKLFGELGHVDKLIEMGKYVDKGSQSSSGTRQSRSRTKPSTSKDYKMNASNSSGSPSRLETVREESEKRKQEGRKVSKFHTRCTSGSSSSPSPPPKIVQNKGKRKGTRPLVLQNTSTQTTPTIKSNNQNQPKSPRTSTASMNPSEKEIEPCECCLQTGNEKNDLCEIVIKITEDGKPEVLVDPVKLKDKNIMVKTNKEQATSPIPLQQSSKAEKLKPPKSPPKKQKVLEKPKGSNKKVEKQKTVDKNNKEKKTENKDFKQASCSSSWREYLSQNSTSSTSYMSPPDFTSTQAVQTLQGYNNISTQVSKQKPSGHIKNILRDKPQQNNLQSNRSVKVGGKFVEPYIFCYIKKLLTMSRKSIDDLPVSSVSEISTPSSSIVNIQSNFSTQQLEDFMKYFNINMTEIQEYLNATPEGSNLHYNTAESLSLSPSPRSLNNCGGETLQDSRFNNYTNQAYPGVLAAYNKLAENCAKKIENLAAMIEKVRLEKLNMLQSPCSGSDKENSTKYLDLPAELKKKKFGESRSPSPNSLLEQEELDRQLCEIDYSFAERLKKMSPEEIREKYPLDNNNIFNGNRSPLNEENNRHNDSSDKELMERYQKLLESYKSDSAKTNLDENSNCACSPKKNEEDATDTSTSFVPLLLDIPRLPKFEDPPPPTTITRNNDKSKPPPSKGISVAKRFNSEVNQIPHELSAIIETESLMSSRLQKSKASESRASTEASPEHLNSNITPKEKITTLTTEAYNPQTSSSSSSLPDIFAELMKTISNEPEKSTSCEKYPQKKTTKQQAHPFKVLEVQSDNSSSDLENMEAMLKSLGMGWAVTTLRKTQEALALTSSSSSIDISVTRKEVKLTDASSSPSEISAKEILNKQLLTKLSSTNDSSGSYTFLKGFQDLSAIYGTDICMGQTTQRTSTPIQSVVSTEKSKSDNTQPKIIVTEESELSSVKDNSDRNNCDCVPFYSLNESSFKSKSSSKDD